VFPKDAGIFAAVSASKTHLGDGRVPENNGKHREFPKLQGRTRMPIIFKEWGSILNLLNGN
jgi:hypothetical protein